MQRHWRFFLLVVITVMALVLPPRPSEAYVATKTLAQMPVTGRLVGGGTFQGIRIKLSIDSFRKHDGFVVLTYTLLQYLRGGPSFSRGLGRQTFGGGTDVGEKAA